MRYPASDATLDRTPTRMMKNPTRRLGAERTSLRISAAISPAFSATPTPTIATNVTATTPNPAKLSTNDDSMNPRREHGDERDQVEEHDHRVRDLVARTLDAVEHPFRAGRGRLGLVDGGRVGHDRTSIVGGIGCGGLSPR